MKHKSNNWSYRGRWILPRTRNTDIPDGVRIIVGDVYVRKNGIVYGPYSTSQWHQRRYKCTPLDQIPNTLRELVEE